MLGTTAVKTQAADTPEAIEKTTKVTVDGKEIEITSSVTFTKTEIPAKGNLITLGGQTPEGEDNLTNVYRVLKMDGTKAFVMSMWNVADSTIKYYTDESKCTTNFTGSGGEINGIKYDGSDLDKYLNETFYNSLQTTNPNIKNAIVPQTIEQKAYGLAFLQPESGNYWTGGTGYNEEPTTYYIENPGYSAPVEGTRNVYALEVEDVINYLGNRAENLNAPNLMKMFFNGPVQENNKYCWLRSAYADSDDYAYGVYADSEYGACLLYRLEYVEDLVEARAAFVVDLSQCAWTLAEK